MPLIAAGVEIGAALKDLDRLDRQARYAQAIALTRVAQYAQGDVIQAVRRSFDRPTPYTVNSTFVKPATPNNLVAEVGFKDRGVVPTEHYLAPETVGGNRALKRFEFQLRRYGVLGAQEYVVPAKGFPLDAYGNISRGVYSAILADLQAHPDSRARSTPDSRARRSRKKLIAKRAVYFATRPGSNLPLGIYQRVKTGFGYAIRGVFMFVGVPRYKVKLPLLQIVTNTYDRHMVDEYNRQLNKAFSSQRAA